MTVALVRRGYSPSGGAERYLLRFAAALREAGHEVVLFASGDWPADALPGRIIRVNDGGRMAFAGALEKLKPREHCDILFSLERVWDCDAYRAGDGVHRAWLERRRAFEPAWRGWFRGMQRKHREILELERALFDPAAKRLIIANSRMVADEITHWFHVPEARIRVIHNGIPMPTTPPPSRAEARTRLGLAGGECALLFAGSGWERKGLRFAIEAVNRCKNTTLIVAGAGKRRNLPPSPKTRFLGEVPDLRAVMSAADLFLLPTLYDPFSNASLEALAAGLPVITTAANGFAEIMRPGLDGEILSAPSDVPAIVAAIAKWSATDLAATRDERRQAAAPFTIERNVRETLYQLGQASTAFRSG